MQEETEEDVISRFDENGKTSKKAKAQVTDDDEETVEEVSIDT